MTALEKQMADALRDLLTTREAEAKASMSLEVATANYSRGASRFEEKAHLKALANASAAEKTARELLAQFDAQAAEQAAGVDLRGLAEKAGISMDCWEMGAGSLAYSEGCHGITRAHLEKFAGFVGFKCWNLALEANPPHMQGFINRAMDELESKSAQPLRELSEEEEVDTAFSWWRDMQPYKGATEKQERAFKDGFRAAMRAARSAK